MGEIIHRPVHLASWGANSVDLLLYTAGRAIDEEDVAGILVRNRGEIDCRYTEKWLLEFDRIAEHKGVASRFNSLLRKHYE